MLFRSGLASGEHHSGAIPERAERGRARRRTACELSMVVHLLHTEKVTLCSAGSCGTGPGPQAQAKHPRLQIVQMASRRPPRSAAVKWLVEDKPASKRITRTSASATVCAVAD